MYPAYRPTALSITGPIPSPLCFSFPTAATTAATPLCTTRRWRDCSDPWPCSWPHLPPYPSQPNPGFHTTWSFVCAPPSPTPHPATSPLFNSTEMHWCNPAPDQEYKVNRALSFHTGHLFSGTTYLSAPSSFFQGYSLTLSANTFHSCEVCTNGSGVYVY